MPRLTLLNGFDGRKQSPERDLGKEILVALLEANGGVVPSSVAYDEGKKAGVSQSTIRRAADDLGLIPEAVRRDNGTVEHWLWRSPVNGKKVTLRVVRRPE